MNIKHSFLILLPLIAIFCRAERVRADLVITFEEKTTYSVSTAKGSYYDGRDTTRVGDYAVQANWTSQGAEFNLNYARQTFTFGGAPTTFEFWSGWAYSNMQDSTTSGFQNQYAAFPGAGAGGSGNYAVAFPDSFINLPASTRVTSLDLTSTTYAALYMSQGRQEPFAPVAPFAADDFMRVTFTGWSQLGGTGTKTGSKTFSLAEGPNPLASWTTLALGDLNSATLGDARSLSVTFSSSDDFAPTYVAIDNLRLQSFSAVPEPSSLALSVAVISSLVAFRKRRSFKRRLPAVSVNS